MPRKKKKAKRGRATRKRGIANRAGHDALVVERRSSALRLRIGGARYRQIATELNVSLDTAWHDVQDSIAETNALSTEHAEELRAVELERLDRYLRGLQDVIAGTNSTLKLRAIEIAVHVSARRAKLLGLDAQQTAPAIEEILRTATEIVHIIQSEIQDQRIVDAIIERITSRMERLAPSGTRVLQAAVIDHG
ncbi:hypothetical protein LCGC14_0795600 [marine sediment metagenome]|uniref:Uncharacterized protein n=1 Tax=marine sediment metagenome TaxID=412755 RepID=A0A0F9SBA5_9ZZZZ